MIKKSSKFKSIDILFALMLFSIFAMSVLMVLLSGGHIYKRAVADISSQYEGRTSISYITTKLRHCDEKDSVRVGSFGDGSALFLSERGDGGEMYETIIYLFEGTVREQYVEKGNSFTPRSGMTILDAHSITFSAEPGDVILVEYETDSGSFKTYVHLRVKGAVSS